MYLKITKKDVEKQWKTDSGAECWRWLSPFRYSLEGKSIFPKSRNVEKTYIQHFSNQPTSGKLPEGCFNQMEILLLAVETIKPWLCLWSTLKSGAKNCLILSHTFEVSDYLFQPFCHRQIFSPLGPKLGSMTRWLSTGRKALEFSFASGSWQIRQ